MNDLDRPILLCGEVGCYAVELWAGGLCREHWDTQHADPRAVTAAMLISGTPPKRRVKAKKGTLLLADGAGSKKHPAARKVKAFGCAVDGCPALEVKARGYCDPHFKRWLRTGDPGPAELLHQGPPPPRALRQTVGSHPRCGLSSAHLFDAPDDDEPLGPRRARQFEAAKLCADCPARRWCEDNLDDLVRYAPTTHGGAGVWAAVEVLANGPRPVTDPSWPTCFACGETKLIDEFPRAVRSGRSRTFRCTACVHAYNTTPERREAKKLHMRRVRAERRAAAASSE